MSIDLEKELKFMAAEYGLTEKQVLNFECVVYWIRDSSMKDYKTQGYIGISTNLRRRVMQHESACRCNSQPYYPAMKELIKSDNHVVDVLFGGSVNDCFMIEHLLRPIDNVGWNQRRGGGRLFLSADKKVMRIFRNMKYQAKLKGLSIEPLWNETLGFFDFERFYKDNCDNGSLKMLLPKTGEINKSSLSFVDCRELVYFNNRKIDFFGDGVLMSNVELSKLLGIDKPNTLATQRKRGWSNGKIFMKAWFNGKD